MNVYRLALIVMAGVFTVAIGWGQAPPQAAGLGAQSGAGRNPVTDSASQNAQLYEEIEILGRILNHGIRRAYGFSQTGREVLLPMGIGAAFLDYDGDGDLDVFVGNGTGIAVGDIDNDGWADLYADDVGTHMVYRNKGNGTFTLAAPHHFSSHPISSVEGNYLKGYGIVYSATLPHPQQDPRPGQARPASKALSEWERVRKELRGEKVDGDKAAPKQEESRLADIVLKLLAENGQHLGQLADTEQVTVAFTFRQNQNQCTKCHNMASGRQPPRAAGGAGAMMGTTGIAGTGRGGLGAGAGAMSGAPGQAKPGTSGGGAQAPNRNPDAKSPTFQDVTTRAGVEIGAKASSSTSPAVAKSILLGDLHLYQSAPKEALNAYLEALRLLAEKPAEIKKYDPQVGALYQKLAQASIAAGDVEGARRWLDKAVEQKAAGALQQSTAASSSAATLPSKLLITAPKKLLDQVGAGKIGFEEFKKGVSTEYLTFSAPEKKPKAEAPPSPRPSNP